MLLWKSVTGIYFLNFWNLRKAIFKRHSDDLRFNFKVNIDGGDEDHGIVNTEKEYLKY